MGRECRFRRNSKNYRQGPALASQDRAAAVVTALAGKHGIATARLRPMGVASLTPVSSNKTEEGRAKNRRVELVER